MTPTVNYAAQIRELESCLPLIEAARTSVPSLVASVSPSPSSAPAHLDLATVYRLASTECELAIKSLSDRLEAIEATLVRAEHSLELDPNGIVPPARHDPSPFERIGDLLGPARGIMSDQAFHPLLDPPKSSAELDTFLATWHANHPTVRLARRRRRDGHPDNVEHVDMTLRGVLKATIVARWEEPTLAMVEIAACSSLKEDNPLYRPSRYSLFQELTNSVMSIIDKSLTRPEERTSNLEEVLTFLSNPPLPF
ncbi:hypothetical protein JCM3766R1_003902 [Sporobolomyces carnicolor]